MNTTDPLELDSLPSDPRENVLRLLGMTTSALKELDANITGSSTSIRGLKIDPQEVFKGALNGTAPLVQQPIQASPIPALIPQVQQVPVVPVSYVAPPAPVQQPTQPAYDPNQLEFDFYKKLKPEDIDQQLKSIVVILKRLEDKVNELTIKVEKKSLELDAN